MRTFDKEEKITLEDLELYDQDMAILDEVRINKINIDIDDEQ